MLSVLKCVRNDVKRRAGAFPFSVLFNCIGMRILFSFKELYLTDIVLTSPDEVTMEEVGQSNQLRAGELIIIVVVLIMWAGERKRCSIGHKQVSRDGETKPGARISLRKLSEVTPPLPAGVIALFCRQYDIIKDNEPNNNKDKAKNSSECSTPEHPTGGLLRSKVGSPVPATVMRRSASVNGEHSGCGLSYVSQTQHRNLQKQPRNANTQSPVTTAPRCIHETSACAFRGGTLSFLRMAAWLIQCFSYRCPRTTTTTTVGCHLSASLRCDSQDGSVLTRPVLRSGPAHG